MNIFEIELKSGGIWDLKMFEMFRVIKALKFSFGRWKIISVMTAASSMSIFEFPKRNCYQTVLNWK